VPCAAPARRPTSLRPRPAATPRPCSFRGCPCPCHAPAHRACCAGRTRSLLFRRSVRDLPPSCAVPRPNHHAVVTSGRASPLFKCHHSPLCATRAADPSPPPPPVSSPLRSLPPLAKPSLPSLRSPSSSYGRTLSFPVPNFAGARATAIVAAGHRRTPRR
jgi:hypothetical protein